LPDSIPRRFALRARLAEFSQRWDGPVNPLRIACIVLPAVLFCGLAWIDYRIELARTRNDVTTTTNAIAEHAGTVVQTIELVIQRVLGHIEGQDWATLATSLETHQFLDRVRHELPQVEAVYLVDPNGVIAASSRAYPMPRYDVHAAEYFATPKASADDAVAISAPSAGTYSGTTGFAVSRRRTTHGEFDGVIGVTVSRQYFDDFYRAILDAPEHSAAALVRTDGAVLVRFPDLPDRLVRLPDSSPALTAIRTGRVSGVFAGRSSEDSRRLIGGFRLVRDLPLFVGYAIDQSVLLANWSVHAGIIGVCAVILSAVLLAMESLARRKMTLENETLRRLLDETERRRRAEAWAQQSQKMEALGRLTGGVAHDFNNLLAVILGSLELVLRRENDPRATRLLRAAMEAAQRGARLTTQMLTFSRKQEIALRSVDVNGVIKGMDELLQRTLGHAVALHYELAEDVWPALADVVQLELSLLNLAVNARDAMPDGGDLTFRTAAIAGNHAADLPPGSELADYVRIQVIDTGEGMSEEVRARAHEPFFTTKGPGGGTGLGLSMVAGFVTELGGALAIDSTPGAGTRISLFLRRADTMPETAAPVSEPVALTTRAGRLLVVDDDAGVRVSVRAMLEELGHHVVEAASGAAVLDMLAGDRQFDLLLIDFAMPVMNGAQLAAGVTRLWPEAPLLFMSGYVENDTLRPWLALGYRTVQKPFSTQELGSAVERAMRQPAAAAD
jgi:signal transduction histidine kinase